MEMNTKLKTIIIILTSVFIIAVVTGLVLLIIKINHTAQPVSDNKNAPVVGDTIQKPSEPATNNSANVLNGLEGIDMGDINSELQDIKDSTK